MLSPPTPADEPERLDCLQTLAVLDSQPETEFDVLVQAASIVCGTPISLLSLVDADRQWFKAAVGLDGVCETPRAISFCGHAILGEAVFEVPDARQDARFADNPLVTGQPGIRFYAGAPLRLGEGTAIGTLCVIDREPRTLSDFQRQLLERLALAAARALEARQVRQALGAAVEQAREEGQQLRLVLDSSPAMIAYWGADLRCRYANHAYREWFGVDPAGLVGKHMVDLLGPALFARNRPFLERALGGEAQSFERQLQRADGASRTTLAFYVPDIVDGTVRGVLAHVVDITEAKRAEGMLRAYRERAEAETELVRFLLSRMSGMESLRSAGVAHFWWPAESFSGDQIAVARSRSGDLYAMLADATGHGLAAALHVVPLSTTFHEMAAKGFSLYSIARRLNGMVKDYSPVDRFIAVTLVRFRCREHVLEVINAGNPPAVLINQQREATREIASGCVPLGILDARSFEPRVEECEVGAEDVLLLFSDGLVEACDRRDRPFGLAGVQAAIYAAASGPEIVAALREALHRHRDGIAPVDDVTVLALHAEDLSGDAAQLAPAGVDVASAVAAEDPVEEYSEDADWSVSVSFSARQLRGIDAVPAVIELTRTLGLEGSVEARLFTILSELVANSLEHGLLGLDSAIKSRPGGFERYFELRSARMATLTEGRLSILVRHWRRSDRAGRFELEVRDTGKGFDHQAFLARHQPRLGGQASTVPSGRGLSLVLAMCESIAFEARGSAVRVGFSYS